MVFGFFFIFSKMEMPEIPWKTVFLWLGGLLLLVLVPFLIWKLKDKVSVPSFGKYLWPTLKWVAGIALLYWGGSRALNLLEAKAVTAEIARAQMQVQFCRQNPYSERCFPADTSTTYLIKRGDEVRVAVPSYFYYDVSGECRHTFRTERRGDVLFLILGTKNDSTRVTARVYRHQTNSSWQASNRCT